MHLRLGKAARHDAQDQTSWQGPGGCRLPAQSGRLQPDPNPQTADGVGKRSLTTPSPPTRARQKKKNAALSRYFSKLLENNSVSRPPPCSMPGQMVFLSGARKPRTPV